MKAKDICKDQCKKKIFFAVRQNNTAQRTKDESCTSKRQQKQANYFEISHISAVLHVHNCVFKLILHAKAKA